MLIMLWLLHDPAQGGEVGNRFCLALCVNKLLCNCYVLFVKFTTTVFSTYTHLGSHVTWDCDFIGRSYTLPGDKQK